MIGEKTVRLGFKLERKKRSSDPDAAPFRTRAERLEATEQCLDVWKKYFQGISDILPGIEGTFETFSVGVAEDLKVLACERVNPYIIINILYTSVWYQRRMDRVFLEAGGRPYSEEIRKLSSTDCWQDGRRSLKRAHRFLSGLMSYGLPQLAVEDQPGREDSPFIRVCKSAADTKESVERLLNIIEELGLYRGGWMWRGVSGKMEPVQTGRRETSKSGRYKAGTRKLHWGFCAAELHYYLERKTEKSHFGTIARLLHFAGFEKEFPVAIPRDGTRLTRSASDLLVARWKYRDRIRRSVEVLLGQDVTRHRVIHRLQDYEVTFEVDPAILGGQLRVRRARSAALAKVRKK